MTTPTITSVTGTVSAGQTLTITGANMLNEAAVSSRFPNNPANWSNSSGLWNSTSPTGWQYPDSPYSDDTAIKIFGTRSIKNHSVGPITTTTTHGAVIDFYPNSLPTITTDLWTRHYVRRAGLVGGTSSGNGPDWEHKMIGIWGLSSGAQMSNFGYGRSISVPGTTQTLHGSHIWMRSTGALNQTFSYETPDWKQNAWQCVECKFPKLGNNTLFQMYLDNVLVVSDSPGNTGNTFPFTGGWMEWNTNWYMANSSFVQDLWMGDLAVNSNARIGPANIIQISNNSTYGSGTLVWQSPVFLSETSSQITCDLTGLGAGPYYLWVTNNIGQRSATYSLSGGAPALPSVPTNFRIVSAPAQTVFFTENFTDNNFAARGWYDSTSGTIDNAVFSPGGGSSSLKVSWTAGSTTPATPTRHLITATDSVYLSFWVKFGTASVTWQGSGVNFHPHMFQILTNSDNDFIGPAWTHLSARFEIRSPFTPRFNFQDAQRINVPQLDVNLLGTATTHAIAGGNGDQVGASSTHWFDGVDWWNDSLYDATPASFVNNTWHFVECYVAMNTIGSVPNANGIVQYWVDGNIVINKSNVYFRTVQYATQKFNKVMFVPYIGPPGSPIAQDMWIDNLIVADRR